jgi:hypothetical protein
MPKYKNIRVKKPNGGYRTQRVQVLASGKYKFVKNKTRASPRRSKVKRAAPARRRAPAKRKVRTVTRRRYTRKKKRSSGRPKRPSLSGMLLAGGAVVTASGTAATLTSGLQDGVMRFAGMLGISSGLGLVAASVLLKYACGAFPYNPLIKGYKNMLAGYGFRP